ncbi:MAG: fatty acid desaturase [Gammaproteobacteria bacterium]
MLSYGLLDLPLWGYFLLTAVMVHVTVMGVTLYLHRDQTHRGLDLHPAIRNFFRLWLWMSTGMITKEWVAVHRKHHARCETEEDPHSPVVLGLRKVLLEGAELYRAEADNPETLEKYGRGTPDDWIERNIYERYTRLGVALMLVIDVVLLGLPGLTVWAVQMVAIPVLAAGVINGLGHAIGYRNFECRDAATNVLPWGVLMGGEELHNNHHAFPSSAKFNLRPWEFDIGWVYISVLSKLGLAKIRRVAPTPVIASERSHIDLETVRALVINRLHVLRDYSRHVMTPVFKQELRASGNRMLARARALLHREPRLLDEHAQNRLEQALAESQQLRTVYEFRQRLQALWETTAQNNERLVQQVKEWCVQAEQTGIHALEEFAQRVRKYSMAHRTA